MFQLEKLESAQRFRLNVTDAICVGPRNHVFLFGGIGHAALIRAMCDVVGKDLIWSTAQFLSYARCGMVMDIDVDVSVSGRNIAQASAVGRVGDEVVLTTSAAFGSRPDTLSYQWMVAPTMPPPEACIEAPVWPIQGGGYVDRLEIRLDPDGPGVGPRNGEVDPNGRLKLWIRSREGDPTDVSLLAILGDFLPAGVASTLGRIGGGNSLDNTLRICNPTCSDWILCDIQIAAIYNGLGHGEVRLYSRDGQLMALASQSLIPRFVSE